MKCEQERINASSIADNVSTEALLFAVNLSKKIASNASKADFKCKPLHLTGNIGFKYLFMPVFLIKPCLACRL
jgi:hypothetical protein